MDQTGTGRLTTREFSVHIDRTVETVLTMVRRGVLPAYDPDDCSWDLALLDDLMARVMAFREQSRERRATALRACVGKAREAKRKKRENREAAQVGRLTRADLGRLVKRTDGAIRLWVKRGGILDAPDADGTWPADLKDRLVAQARAFKFRDKQRRRGLLMYAPPVIKQPKAVNDLAPRTVTDLALAQSNLKLLTQHFDGDERAAWKFLEDFAGTTLRMPTPASVERLRAERAVVKALHRDPSRGTLRRLDDIYDLGPSGSATKTFRRQTGSGVRALRESMASKISDQDLYDA